MNKKKFICVVENFILGGVESYFIRMFEWAREHDMATYLFYENQFSPQWSSSVKKLGVNVYQMKSIGTKPRLERVWGEPERIETIKDAVIVVPSMEKAIRIKKLYPKDNKIVLYVLHPNDSVLSPRFKWLNKIGKKEFVNEAFSQGIIFMGKQEKQIFDQEFEIQTSQEAICRLGMEIRPYDKELVRKRYQKDKCVILSISRMEFPFKGYVFGLMQTFLKLKKKYPNLELWLVGDGCDYKRLEQTYNELDSDEKAHIKLIGSVAYEQLGEYFHKARLNVGMGTTVLDAANYSVPSIVAPSYQEAEYSCGFWADSPETVGNVFDKRPKDDYGILYDDIDKILDCGEDEYISKCELSHRCLEKNYGIDRAMEKIISMPGVELPNKKMWIIEMFYFVKRVYLKVVGGRI